MRKLGEWRPTIIPTKQEAIEAVKVQTGLATLVYFFGHLDQEVPPDHWRNTVASMVNNAVANAIEFSDVSPQEAVAAIGRGVQRIIP